MIVIGLDPGSAITGYGIIEEDNQKNQEIIKYGVIQTQPSSLPEERLIQLYDQLSDILSLYHPQQAAVERLFFYKNVKTAIAVGQARGVALLALAKANISIYEYSPMEIKQAVTGLGNAEKFQVQIMVKALLGLNEIPKPDDAADAIAAAICHLNNWQHQKLAGNH